MKISSSLAIPNLQTILDDKPDDTEEENALVDGNEFAQISYSDFLEKWQEFAKKAKSESKITLFTIMTSNPPRLIDNRIEVDVENGVQQDEIKIWKIDILNFLRQSLRNYALDLVYIQLEQSVVRKAYTSQEKYKAMVEKNPALETLRRKFNLGLS